MKIFVFLLIVIAVFGIYAYITFNETTDIVENKNQANSSDNNGVLVEEKYIGKDRAKQIAKDFFDEYMIYYADIRSIDFVTINGVPLYRVNYFDNYITYDGTPRGWEEVYIGAIDGKLHDSYGTPIDN